VSEQRPGLPALLAPEPHARGARVDDDNVREFLAFMLGDECHALPLACVREILRVPEVAEVPRAPRDVLGIISVRGQITTLIDLRVRLSLPINEVTPRARVLIVDSGDEMLGLLCDRVLQVYRLRDDQIELSSVLGHDMSSHVHGIGRPKKRKAGVATGRAQREVEGAGDLLILLDPVVLLRRPTHG
jgi:purine-binding chemotaxis protein CheW